MPTTFVPSPLTYQDLHVLLGYVNTIASISGGGATVTISGPSLGVGFFPSDVGNTIAVIPTTDVGTAEWGTITAYSSNLVVSTSITGGNNVPPYKVVVFRETDYLVGSMDISSNLTTRPTANFSMDNPGLGFSVANMVGMPVLITHSVFGDQFGGSIEQATAQNYPGQSAINQIHLECVGFQHTFEKRLVSLAATTNVKTDYFIGNNTQKNFNLASTPTGPPTGSIRVAYGIRGASWAVNGAAQGIATLVFEGSSPTPGQSFDVFGVQIEPGSGGGYNGVGFTCLSNGTDDLGRNTATYALPFNPGSYLAVLLIDKNFTGTLYLNVNGYVAINPGTTMNFQPLGSPSGDWFYSLNTTGISQSSLEAPMNIFNVLTVTYPYAVQLDFYNQAPETIIQTLVGIAVSEGCRTNLIASGIVIDHIQFDTGDSLWSAILKVCRFISNGTTNYWAYIDTRFILNFAIQGITTAAPWNISSTDLGNALVDVSVVVTREKYANAAIVETDSTLDPNSVDDPTSIGNGTQKSFNVTQPIGAPIAIVLQSTMPPLGIFSNALVGLAQTFGTLGDPATPFGSRQWYWTAGSATLLQDPFDTPLTNQQRLMVNYQPLLKTLDQNVDSAAIAVRSAIELGSGEIDMYESLSGVQPVAAGFDAASTITGYFSTLSSEIHIVTFRGGLQPGMAINVLLADISVNGPYVVDKVHLTDEDGDLLWTCTLIQGASLGDWKTSFLELSGQLDAVGVALNSGPTQAGPPESAQGVWQPGVDAPITGDGMFMSPSFGVAQSYPPGQDGNPVPTVTVTGYVGPPTANFSSLLFKVMREFVSGYFEQELFSVAAHTLSFGGSGLPVNGFVGLVLSLGGEGQIGTTPAGDTPMQNYVITANDAVGNFTVTPDPMAQAVVPQLGDIFACRTGAGIGGGTVATPMTFTATGFNGALFNNTYNAATGGLVVNGNKGNLILIIAGTGAGQAAQTITANTATGATISPGWSTTPDATSCLVFLEAQPQITLASSPFINNVIQATPFSIPVPNYAQQVIRIEAYPQTSDGSIGDQPSVCFRELYIWGAQGSTEISASATQMVTQKHLTINTASAPGGSTTTLAAAISSPITTPTAISTAAAVSPTGTQFTIGSEQFIINSGGGTTTPTVTGGQNGTTAATHAMSAVVNLPGHITFQLLPIAAIGNQELMLQKTNDINYAVVNTDSTNTFRDGSTQRIIGGITPSHYKFPTGQTAITELNAGGVSVMTSGGGGGGGSNPAPIVTTLTANWVPTIPAPASNGLVLLIIATQNSTGGWSIDWTGGGSNPVSANTFPQVPAGLMAAGTSVTVIAVSSGGIWYAAALGVTL